MIILTAGQTVLNTGAIVVTGGEYEEEENVLVRSDEGVESQLQAYYIVHGIVYAERQE
jgi:hypothetical protein